MKLVRREPETRALFAFLRSRPERVTSVVAAVEVPRALRRAAGSPVALRRADSVLSRLGLVELGTSIQECAAVLAPAILRTLDAIHVATALELGDDVEGFVTYDERQSAAVREAALLVFSPRDA